jgi:hypothetical protein
MRRLVPLAIATLVIFLGVRAGAQVTPPGIGGTVINTGNGVIIDPDGKLQQRQVDDKNDLAAQRLRVKALNQQLKSQDLTYVSLAKLFAEVRSHVEAKQELPERLRHLSGLTQVRYVFLFPEEHDIVIAGASEPVDATNKCQPIGKLTARPVMHLDDLVTALRMCSSARQRQFGCSLDPNPDSLNRSNAVMRDMAKAGRAARMQGLKEAVGPQGVRVFGIPADTRLLFVTIAADYKLKRFFLGLDPIPVAGVGLPVDNTRAAGNRFWFELDYAPLLVSPEGDAFEFRGQRLTLKAGAFSFDERGATETSKRFAKNMSARMPQLATTIPLFADLQNVADLCVLATLIRRDHLDQRAGLDLSWIGSEANYKTTVVPTPRSAETLVNYTNGSLVAGGVSFIVTDPVAESNRQQDTQGALKAARARPTSDNWWTTHGSGEGK